MFGKADRAAGDVARAVVIAVVDQRLHLLARDQRRLARIRDAEGGRQTERRIIPAHQIEIEAVDRADLCARQERDLTGEKRVVAALRQCVGQRP